MILISHRGNIDGKNTARENHPDYIQESLDEGYNAEIDIWVEEGSPYSGHDAPQYKLTENWLLERADKLWIHCKNFKAMEWFHQRAGFNYFWHQGDDFTLTSGGFIWTYPGRELSEYSVSVKPEETDENPTDCYGVCSDFVGRFRRE